MALPTGRPVPRPLEVEIFGRFQRWDSRYADVRKEMYPHLVKPAPAVGDVGLGSVCWVGLNPDPCKAKFMNKGGAKRPASAPSARCVRATHRTTVCRSSDSQDGAATPANSEKSKGLRPSSAPCSGRRGRCIESRAGELRGPHCNLDAIAAAAAAQSAKCTQAATPRQLGRMSANIHYLEQKLKLPGGIPNDDASGPNGCWRTARPADFQELLYAGTSHEGKGRFSYLRARNTLQPQDKLTQPLTAAQEIGWTSTAGTPARCLPPVANQKVACVVPC